MYNVFVERRLIDNVDYCAFVLEGNGVFLHKTWAYKMPSGVKPNARLAYIDYVAKVAKYIKSLVDYGELKDDKFCFLTTHATCADYINNLRSFGDIGSKPPKSYFSTAWNLYAVLEKFSNYTFEYRDWATKAKTYASPKYVESEKREKAIDAFVDM